MSFCLSAPGVYPAEGVSVSDQTISDEQAVARAVLARRYRHQETAAGLLRHRRALQGCHRWVAFGKDAVDLVSYPALKKGKLKGLQSCGSPHICPVCAPKIAERRVRYDLTPGLARARELGLGVLVLTMTLRHILGDDFDAVMAGLLLARETSRSGGRWTRLRQKYGILGTIRAFECTYGLAGFHPHFHELLFTEAPLSREQQHQFIAELTDIWQASVVKAGLAPVTREHGLYASAAHERIEEYVQKQLHAGVPAQEVKRPQWDLPQEMAKQPVKKGRTANGVKGYSMFELLAIAAEGEVVEGAPSPHRAAAIFREYDSVITKRRVRQLYWSPGLKALLGVQDLSDAQIEALDEEDQEAEIFARLAPPEISALVADGKRAQLTSLLAEHDLAGTLACIAPYRRAWATEKFDPVWEELYPARAFDPNAPAVVSPHVVLTDWQADERDFLPPLRACLDPQVQDVYAGPNLEVGLHLLNRLRERHAAGQPVAFLQDHYRVIRERRVTQDPVTAFLGGVWLAAGGQGGVEGRVLSSDGLGRTQGEEVLTDRAGESVVKQLSPGRFTRPGDWAILRLLAWLLRLAPHLAPELAHEEAPPALAVGQTALDV